MLKNEDAKKSSRMVKGLKWLRIVLCFAAGFSIAAIGKAYQLSIGAEHALLVGVLLLIGLLSGGIVAWAEKK